MFDLTELEKLPGNKIEPLQQGGSFDSEECLEYLKECDIVCTNEPFSMFRRFFDLLVEYDKKYLIIVNQNSITKYKPSVFQFVNEKHFFGYSECKTFITSEGFVQHLGNCAWLQNLERPNKPYLQLNEKFNNSYKKYDNYDAWDCARIKDIPKDFFETLGVPISFLHKHNPDQFEILGVSDGFDYGSIKPTKRYRETFIFYPDDSYKKAGSLNTNVNVLVKEKPNSKCYYIADGVDGYLISKYSRVFIRRKKNST